MTITIALVVAYLLGSLPTGYLIAKAYGVNIQRLGSGNIGATNVLRTVGRLPALIVVLVDPLKGALAVLLAKWLGLGMWGIAAAALAVVLGNNFNIFLRLRGGKGIATSLGAFLPIDPLTTVAAMVIGIFTIWLGRYVSIGSLVGVFSALCLHLKGTPTLPYTLLLVFIFALAMFRHKDNIKRLAEGNERRLGQKKTEAQDEATTLSETPVPEVSDVTSPNPQAAH